MSRDKSAAFAKKRTLRVKPAHRKSRFFRPMRSPPALRDRGHLRDDRFVRQLLRPVFFTGDARFFHTPQVVPQVLEAFPSQRKVC